MLDQPPRLWQPPQKYPTSLLCWGPQSTFPGDPSQRLSRKSCSCPDAASPTPITLKWPHLCSMFGAQTRPHVRTGAFMNRIECPAHKPQGEFSRPCL